MLSLVAAVATTEPKASIDPGPRRPDPAPPGVTRSTGGDRPLLHPLRWISALLVLNGQALILAWGDPSSPPAAGPWSPLISLLIGWREPAVLVFFVISGYLVGGGVLRRGASFD